MRARGSWLFGVLVVLAGCGGPPDPGTDAGSSVDCTGESDGTACGEGTICLASACVESRCGDAFIDSARGEECEDGNDAAFDGCDPGTCTLSCHTNDDCDDGNPCNGTESCNPTHRCISDGVTIAPGDPCGTEAFSNGVCRPGAEVVCVMADVCGNEVVEEGEDCDDGNTDDEDGCTGACHFTCTTDAECGDDGDACNGIERCDLTHVCMVDTPPTAAWYVDCDGDGFAPSAVGSMESCTEPTTPPDCPSAGGHWVALAPADPSSIDCYDGSADMRPGQTDIFTSSSGALVRPFDYDCDGVEEQTYPTGSVSTSAPCEVSCTFCLCNGDAGWTGAPPACGLSDVYTYCEDRLGEGCVRITEPQTQSCQ